MFGKEEVKMLKFMDKKEEMRMKQFGKYDFQEVLKEIRKVYQIPNGKKVNIKFYEFDKNYGRWHIQVKKGEPDLLVTGYEPGKGEWWSIEMWLQKEDRPEPVLLPM